MSKRNILDCMTLVGAAPSRYEGKKKKLCKHWRC